MRRYLERSGGFTLVELLVAVSVIAMLTAMLVPSLRKTREQGRRVKCMAHLRGLSHSWEIYTMEYRSPPQLARRGVDVNWRCQGPDSRRCEWRAVHVGGFGPEYFDTYLSINNDRQVWLSAMHHRFHLFQVSNPPPPGPLPGHWWNFGTIWLSGVVQDPRAFFCPSVRDPDFAWDTPLNPWPPSRDAMWRPDRPWQVNHTQSSYERRIALTGVLWDRIPSQTALMHDIAAPNIDEIAHKVGSNVAYRDGHVAFVRSDVFSNWWERGDRWSSEDTKRKLLAFSYWMDRGGGRWPIEGEE